MTSNGPLAVGPASTTKLASSVELSMKADPGGVADPASGEQGGAGAPSSRSGAWW